MWIQDYACFSTKFFDGINCPVKMGAGFVVDADHSGAVLAELGRQPRFARQWFIKYQEFRACAKRPGNPDCLKD